MLALVLGIFLFSQNSFADSCGSTVWFADTSHWTGERSRYCGSNERARNIGFAKQRYDSGDKEEYGMALGCCSLTDVNGSGDTCEERWVVPTSSGKWTGTKSDGCFARPGGYVAGFRFFAYKYRTDFDSNFLAIRCCYPQNPSLYTETCGDWRQLGGTYHWPSEKQYQSCSGSQGFIREVRFHQAYYSANDRDEHQMDINCCRLTVIPTPTSPPVTTTTTTGGPPSSTTTTTTTTTTGGPPPSCTGGQSWNATTNLCECPAATPNWNGSSCLACIGGQSWNATTSACECPSSTPNWNGSSCVAGCSGGQIWNPTTNTCACPPTSPNWNGSTCVAGCTGGQSWNATTKTCECPASNPNWNGSTCVAACTGGQIWSVITNQCECPSSTPYWVAGSCKAHITCPSGSIDDPLQWDNCICNVKGQFFDLAANECRCPNDYESLVVDRTTSTVECRPKNPGSQFYRDGSSLDPFYPVCGAGRVPTDGARTLQNATSDIPHSSATAPGPNGFTYRYATGSGMNTQYLYRNFNQCACTWKNYTATGASMNGVPVTSDKTVNGKKRFYSSEYALVASQNFAESVQYGAIAISKSETVDGRAGLIFHSGYSKCACPNLNEEMRPIDPGEPYPTGAVCQSLVKPGDFRVLVKYDPSIHDISAGKSQVMNRAVEVYHASGHVMGKAILPDGAGSRIYDRKIWTCAAPMSLNVMTGECYFDSAKNACSEGNGSDIEASVVSNNVSGSDDSQRFLNAINKKLACCLNQFRTSGVDPVKFDCIENPRTSYKDFDELWSSADTSVDGGQLNAVLLTNTQGRWLSGFYTVDGSRCEEFSEFAGELQPALVNPVDGVGAQMRRAGGKLDPQAIETIGSTIPAPGSGSGGGSAAAQTIRSKMSGLDKSVPTLAPDRRRCPILVRAAIAASCSSEPHVPGTPIVTYDGPPKRCSSASQIQVHIRVEQLTEIAGQPKLKTVDTVIDVGADGKAGLGSAVISIDRIIANKYGNVCPPPMVSDPSGGPCRF